MQADGAVATSFTMIQKSPVILTSDVPSGTGLRFRGLHLHAPNREASRL